MHLAIVGSRNFNDYKKFKTFVIDYIKRTGKPQLIISGGARGADTLAKRFAQEEKIDINEYLPNWDAYGKAAGPIRNAKIIADATHLIAFPSREGSGTQNTINLAQKKGIPVEIFYID